jgi:tol-pal system protein YbgF
MSSRIYGIARVAAIAALLALSSPGFAQQSYDDPELRVQQLENRLRQLTGQNEELQYRNRQLEERLRALQGGAQAAPGGAPAVLHPNIANAPPAQPNPRQPLLPPDQQIAAPAPIVQEPPQGVPPMQGRRRGDAFDPSQNPNAPGVPQALGGGQLPIPAEAPVGAPGGRGAGEPLDLANTGGPRNPPGALPLPGTPGAGATLTTLPPSATPKDEFDLGIGYMQRKDYALAEETMRSFAQKYPSDPLMAASQYWLGESFFQRQLYRDAAEAFLAVTTKFDKSAKAPDALLRLGQSLAALKEKEAACAALGEVTRKYPRASSGVKAAVGREQKRNKC